MNEMPFAMKKVLTVTLVLMMTLGLAAQTKPPQQQHQQKPPAERAQNLVDYLATKMKLSQKKQDAMVPVFATYFTDVSKASASHNPSGMETSKKKLDASMLKILTEAEYKQVNKLIEEKMASMPRH
jgi:hypothetical protein